MRYLLTALLLLNIAILPVHASFFGPGGYGAGFYNTGADVTVESIFGDDLRADWPGNNNDLFTLDTGNIQYWSAENDPANDNGTRLNKLSTAQPSTKSGGSEFNNQQVVEFDGTERMDTNGTDFGAPSASGATILMVVNIPTSANGNIFDWAPGTSSQVGINCYYFSGQLLFRVYSGSGLKTVAYTIGTPTGKILLELRFTPNDFLRAYINGSPVGTPVAVTTLDFSPNRFWLASLGGGGSPKALDVARTTVVNGPITSQQRAAYQVLMADKLGAF